MLVAGKSPLPTVKGNGPLVWNVEVWNSGPPGELEKKRNEMPLYSLLEMLKSKSKHAIDHIIICRRRNHVAFLEIVQYGKNIK